MQKMNMQKHVYVRIFTWKHDNHGGLRIFKMLTYFDLKLQLSFVMPESSDLESALTT